MVFTSDGPHAQAPRWQLPKELMHLRPTSRCSTVIDLDPLMLRPDVHTLAVDLNRRAQLSEHARQE